MKTKSSNRPRRSRQLRSTRRRARIRLQRRIRKEDNSSGSGKVIVIERRDGYRLAA